MRLFKTTLFLTGGITLGLEVIASRIMTPYFGVSLYIWSAILSATLLALAFGYHLGGRMASAIPTERQKSLFVFLPAFSAFFLACMRLIYPTLFYRLASFDLVSGSFMAAIIFLGVPLIMLSALNPLLVSLLKEGKESEGDAGSGDVFCLSTVGSVAGVLGTTFLLIPYFTNSSALLWTLVLLSGASVLLALFLIRSLPKVEKVFCYFSFISFAFCLALSLLAIEGGTRFAFEPETKERGWSIRAVYPSFFSTLKVVDVEPRGDEKSQLRYLSQDGLTQNFFELDTGRPRGAYIYMLARMGLAARPKSKTALMLGLGTGFVPTMLAKNGVVSDSVEINPAMVQAAVDHFNFSPDVTTVYEQDARTFVRSCPRKYDLLLADVFHGDSMPAHLMTGDFFADVAACGTEEAVFVMNTIQSKKVPETLQSYVATIGSAFRYVSLLQVKARPDELSRAATIVASNAPLSEGLSFFTKDMPLKTADKVESAFENQRALTRAEIESVPASWDEHNYFSRSQARTETDLRANIIKKIPYALLVN